MRARDPLSALGRSRMSALTILLLVMAPGAARACSVCFGNPDSPHTQGMANAILFLLAVIAAVLVGFAAFFLHLRRMARVARAGDVGVLPGRGRLPGAGSRRNGTNGAGRRFDQ